MHSSPKESLEMPALRFFAVLRESKALHTRNKYHFLHELMPLMSIGHAGEGYVEQLAGSYRRMYEKKNDFNDLSDEEKLLHNRSVSSKMEFIFMQAGQN
jgi:hypothetical protein